MSNATDITHSRIEISQNLADKLATQLDRLEFCIIKNANQQHQFTLFFASETSVCWEWNNGIKSYVFYIKGKSGQELIERLCSFDRMWVNDPSGSFVVQFVAV